MNDIISEVKKHRILGDGAFGTYYSGLRGGREEFPERDNLRHPEFIKQVHRDYLAAGARFLRTNTFAANRELLECSETELHSVIKAGYRIAKEAADEWEEPVFVAADIGPLPMDIRQSADSARREYLSICDAFLEEGADIFLFETFADLKIIQPVLEALKERSGAAIFVSFCVNGYGYSKYGISAARLLAMAGDTPQIDGVGFNCGIGPGHLYQVLKGLSFPEGKILSVFPNAGYPDMQAGRTGFTESQPYFAARMEEIANLGAGLLGGCCGTNPNYIEEMRRRIDFQIRPVTVSVPRTEEAGRKEETLPNPFMEKLSRGQKPVAVELDPPFDGDARRLMECANALKPAPVDILTFADSPMGRSRVDSLLMSTKVQYETGLSVMPHIACRDKNTIALRAALLGAHVNGIRNLLVVTGDPVPGGARGDITGVFDFNSITLMQFIRELNEEHFPGDPICYGGALNQGRKNPDAEIRRMIRKIEAGASYFLTQPVFSEEEIERIRYIKERVDTKILCGLMPLISYRNACFIRNEVTGIQVPDEVVAAFRPDMTREEGEAAGTAVVKRVMRQLDGIADGYYFMLPFNRVHLVEQCLQED